jgi:hypothetical protein
LRTQLCRIVASVLVAALFLGFGGSGPAPAQVKKSLQSRLKQALQKGSSVWTLEETLAQLRLYPNDPYLQYVAMMLADRRGNQEQVAQQIDQLISRDARMQGMERARDVDLFSIFTGALAVQESLQLSAMRGDVSRPPLPRRAAERIPPMPRTKGVEASRADEPPPNIPVKVASVLGPKIQSHPWEQMLGGRKPRISPLAYCVPEDFYFIDFHSLTRLLEVMEISDLWGTHLFNQTAQESRTQRIGDRLREQLAIETNSLLRPLYDLVLERVGVTGSDLFVREGSDVTLLFRFKQPEVFKARMDGFLSNAQKKYKDAQRSTGSCLGVDYVHVATHDRTVHVFSAYPEAGLHVRSNSLVALERVLEAIRGTKADEYGTHRVRRLGDTAEFAYIRTLMPEGASEETGFVYLSDPFIRRLMGPKLKLTEQRRMLCYAYLRMIGHAAMLYRSEQGRNAQSIEELIQARCLPKHVSWGELAACPDGGKHSLSADGLSGVCSHHGHAHFLRPCCEIPVREVTRTEADEYNRFLEEYNQYWRTFFDPIALRLQITPQRYRLKTIILPLIDNSIYTGLAAVLGGRPEPLDALPVPKRNIFSVAVRVNKGDAEQKTPGAVEQAKCANNLKNIGVALHNYHDVFGKFPAIANFSKEGKPLLSWRVQILPYLDQDKLYRQFHLDEPWDSEHNKKLIAQIPSVYRCPSANPRETGKTTYLAPVLEDKPGVGSMWTPSQRQLRISDVLDGTSNTIFVVDADDGHAVPWTKPEDLAYDPKQPLAGLIGHHANSLQALFVDGSVHRLRQSIAPEALRALFTPAGGEIVDWSAEEITTVQFQPQEWLRGLRYFMGYGGQEVEKLGVEEFLLRGLGSQVSLHVCDSEPLFDFNLPAALGQAIGTFQGRGPGLGMNELPFVFLAASIQAPVYIAAPIADAKIVDKFLRRLDNLLVNVARQQENFGGFLSLQHDFYQIPLGDETTCRSFVIQFGPMKWRVFWARIGNGLYIASKKFILDDIQLLSKATPSKPAEFGPAAHAFLRIRAENWDRVLNEFHLGWAENGRIACLNNIGPLSSVARSLHGKAAAAGARSLEWEDIARLAGKMFDVHFFCPDGGRYELASDGKSVICSVHGSAQSPRQRPDWSEKGPQGKAMASFGGMTATLTFLEDGLHAVVTIDRK